MKYYRWTCYSLYLHFLFVNLFNVVGVLIGLTNQAEVPQDQQMAVQSSCMKVAAIGTIVGSAVGTSPHIVAVESAAGIAEGGRTGLTALTIAAFIYCISILGTIAYGHSRGGYSSRIDCSGLIYDVLREGY